MAPRLMGVTNGGLHKFGWDERLAFSHEESYILREITRAVARMLSRTVDETMAKTGWGRGF